MSTESCCNNSCSSNAKTDKKWLKISFWLLIATIGYNFIEAILAIISGANANSISLEGFGLDSLIEVSAAVMFLWRLLKEFQGADKEEIEESERFVKRFIGGTFLTLAVYIGYTAIIDLLYHHIPQESIIGIILAILSIMVMPILVKKKLEAAKHINSEALAMEAKETLCCFYLSVILLVGLSSNVLFGWWWADPVCALLMLYWLIREGLEAIKGKECCGGN